MKLRDYQYELSVEASQRLKEFGMAYLSMEVRTGKTLTSIATAQNITKINGSHGRVLFVTKKKAIGDVQGQYEAYCGNMDLFTVINYECGGERT